MIHRTLVFSIVLLAALAVWACGDDDSTVSSCVPGKEELCPCDGELTGTQTCLEDGTWGACDCGGGDSDTDADSDTDTDTDGDSDSATGADTDTDTDTDTDVDADSDSDADLVLGSDCDDGSVCLQLPWLGDETLGICTPECEEADNTNCVHSFTAQGQCALTDNAGTFWCILVCNDESECPPDQSCIWVESASICYPDVGAEPEAECTLNSGWPCTCDLFD